jgi:TolB-like protein
MKLKLSGQPFQVLAILLERPGEIVTRDELQKRLWPDTFVDIDHNLNAAINKIREVLGDSAENPRFVETMPRRGYRFIAPIQAARTGERPEGRFSKRWRVGLALVGAVALLLVLGAGKVRRLLFARSRAFEIRSIAVLPLENLSNDPGQDYFGEGITETLTTNLAQMGTIRVISRTSAMRFQGLQGKVAEIGRQLNVEAIVEGSVMREGDRVRVTAQLIDAQNDRHLWAKTYEREFWGVLSLPDEVAHDIASEIRVKLTPEQESRLAADRKTNPKAYDEYLRGRYLWGQRTNDSVTKAVEHFRRAI